MFKSQNVILVAHGPVGASPLRPGRTYAPAGPGLSGSGFYDALGCAVSLFSPLWRGLRFLPLKRCAGFLVMRTYLSPVARTTLAKVCLQLPCARPTGSYHWVGAPTRLEPRPYDMLPPSCIG